jgi:hypothetical protein
MKKKQSSKKLTIPTEHSYNDHTDFPPPLVHTLNPTDINIGAFSNPDEVKNDEPFYSKEWQKKTATDAKDIRGIRLYDLVFIMASEECYSKILPELWGYSGLNDDTRQRFPKWKASFAANRQSRSRVWYWLLCRWTIFEKYIDKTQSIESYYFSHLKKINLLSLYDHINGEFQPVSKKEAPVQSPEHYIKLDEFEKYLKKIGEISIPLPALLDSKQRGVPKVKKLRPSQMHRDECRKVAAKFWEKYPEMTIADMIDRAEILEVSKKNNGKAYMEKTVRNWIKDLCPDRSPGRRKRT